MLVITSGSKDEVKKEMKARGKAITDELKAVRREYRRVQDRPDWINRKIDELERLQEKYMVSKIIPVRVGNMIINYLVYERFMKKIRRCTVKHFVDPDGFSIEYRTGVRGKGHVDFFDLSKYFGDFQNLPVAEVKEGEVNG